MMSMMMMTKMVMMMVVSHLLVQTFQQKKMKTIREKVNSINLFFVEGASGFKLLSF